MKKILIIIILSTIFLSSCVRFLLNKYGIINRKAEIKEIKVKDKHVLFLPMIHITEQKFYDNCKKIIDSLSNKEYYIFGESIISESLLTSDVMSVQDTIYDKKIRKILNIDVGFYTKSDFFIKFQRKYNLVAQPRDIYCVNPRVDTSSCKFVDCTTETIIESYEKEKGEVVLDDYDKKTKIGEEYNQKNHNEDNKKYFMKMLGNIRNQYIANEIRYSKRKKILLIYGANHYEPLKVLLEGKKIK